MTAARACDSVAVTWACMELSDGERAPDDSLLAAAHCLMLGGSAVAEERSEGGPRFPKTGEAGTSCMGAVEGPAALCWGSGGTKPHSMQHSKPVAVMMSMGRSQAQRSQKRCTFASMNASCASRNSLSAWAAAHGARPSTAALPALPGRGQERAVDAVSHAGVMIYTGPLHVAQTSSALHASNSVCTSCLQTPQ